MATAQQGNPSYWWWVLAWVLALVGGLIAWGLNRQKHPYPAKAMLLVGALSTVTDILASLS